MFKARIVIKENWFPLLIQNSSGAADTVLELLSLHYSDDVNRSISNPSPPISSPGSPPGMETGELIASVNIARETNRRWVYWDTDYSAALEMGYGPRNLQARPFLRPAAQRLIRQLGPIAKESFMPAIWGRGGFRSFSRDSAGGQRARASRKKK